MRSDETTLWRFFDCLVDAVTVMEYGNEAKYDPISGEAFVLEVVDWGQVIHFDLKPENGQRYSFPFVPSY